MNVVLSRADIQSVNSFRINLLIRFEIIVTRANQSMFNSFFVCDKSFNVNSPFECDVSKVNTTIQPFIHGERRLQLQASIVHRNNVQPNECNRQIKITLQFIPLHFVRNRCGQMFVGCHSMSYKRIFNAHEKSLRCSIFICFFLSQSEAPLNPYTLLLSISLHRRWLSAFCIVDFCAPFCSRHFDMKKQPLHRLAFTRIRTVSHGIYCICTKR